MPSKAAMGALPVDKAATVGQLPPPVRLAILFPPPSLVAIATGTVEQCDGSVVCK